MLRPESDLLASPGSIEMSSAPANAADHNRFFQAGAWQGGGRDLTRKDGQVKKGNDPPAKKSYDLKGAQADLERIEIDEQVAIAVVDAAMRFVGND